MLVAGPVWGDGAGSCVVEDVVAAGHGIVKLRLHECCSLCSCCIKKLADRQCPIPSLRFEPWRAGRDACTRDQCRATAASGAESGHGTAGDRSLAGGAVPWHLLKSRRAMRKGFGTLKVASDQTAVTSAGPLLAKRKEPSGGAAAYPVTEGGASRKASLLRAGSMNPSPIHPPNPCVTPQAAVGEAASNASA